jgi:hypothetical protein
MTLVIEIPCIVPQTIQAYAIIKQIAGAMNKLGFEHRGGGGGGFVIKDITGNTDYDKPIKRDWSPADPNDPDNNRPNWFKCGE